MTNKLENMHSDSALVHPTVMLNFAKNHLSCHLLLVCLDVEFGEDIFNHGKAIMI